MALTKAVTDQAGVTANYWRVVSAEAIHAEPSAVHVRLAGYVSQEGREAGAPPVAERFFRLVEGDVPDMHTVTTAQIYDAIKARVDAEVSAPPAAAPLSASDATATVRAPAVPDPLAGAADA